MTNDDRNHDDRTSDGKTPSWGQPQGDTPRYGERITPASAPQYGESAPQQQYGEQPRWGEHAPAQQPQYGQQHDQSAQQQYGQAPQQYGQQPDQYAQQQHGAGAPAWQAHDEPKPKKKTVGRVALLVAVIALVVGVVGGFVLGNVLGSSGAMRGVLDGSTTGADPQQLSRDLANDPGVRSQLTLGSVLMGAGTLFGLWAIVQGIIAIATKRGRGWGVVALILAVVAAIVAFSVYIGVAVAMSGAAS